VYTCPISFESVQCVRSQRQKRNFGQILTLGLLYTASFSEEGQIWHVIVQHGSPQPCFTCEIYVPNFVLMSLFCLILAAKNTKFCPFLDFWRFVCRQWRLMKNVESVFEVSKSFLYSNDFMTKSCAQSLSFKRVMDKHKHKPYHQVDDDVLIRSPNGSVLCHTTGSRYRPVSVPGLITDAEVT